MSATYAANPWAPDAGGPRRGPWTFAREVEVAAGTGLRRGLQWLLKPNVSISPRQLLAVYLSLCAVSLAIGAMFAAHGAPYVLGFAGLELAIVGLALLAYARHTGDRETLTLIGGSLLVEQRYGSRIERTDFVADWLTVEPAGGQNSLVELSGGGRRVRVGRYLRPELRGEFARELRGALRRRLPEPPPVPRTT